MSDPVQSHCFLSKYCHITKQSYRKRGSIMSRAEDILRQYGIIVKLAYRTTCIWRAQELLRTAFILVVIRAFPLQEFTTIITFITLSRARDFRSIITVIPLSRDKEFRSIITVIPLSRDKHFSILSIVHVVVCSKVETDINGHFRPRKSEHTTQI